MKFSESLEKCNNNLLDLIKEIFPDLDQKSCQETSSTQKVSFKCRCNRNRSVSALKILGNKELEKILEEDGKAELICHFCKNMYLINRSELNDLINSK